MFLEKFRHVLFLLAFHALPFCSYAIVSRRFSRGGKLGALAAYAAVVAAVLVLRADVGLGVVALGRAYYLALGVAVPRCALALRSKRLTPGALFAGFATAYLLLPGIAAPGIAGATFLVVGFNLLLSSYSYCLDVSASRQNPDFRDCLFFLLVNPTVTYSNRGDRVGEPRFDPRAAARVLAGLSTMLVASAVLTPVQTALTIGSTPFDRIPTGGFGLAILGTLRVLAIYASHSGLASIQIGFMRLLGYRVPERYNFPLLAVSPLDFWRRWNTYFGSWLAKYVFIPVARRLHGPTGSWAKGLALLVTFVTSGLLHDAFTYAGGFTVSARFSTFFLISGLVAVSWAGAQILCGGRRTSVTRLRAGAITTGFGRFCVLGGLVVAAAIWG